MLCWTRWLGLLFLLVIMTSGLSSLLTDNDNEIREHDWNPESSIVSEDNESVNKDANIANDFPYDMNEAKNEKAPPRKHEFRSNKVQKIWEKAKKTYLNDPPMLGKLKKELQQHDDREIEYKKAKTIGVSDEGAEEAKLRQQLLGIMSKFGLAGKQVPVPDKDSVLKDDRLRLLWEHAQSAGYNEDELHELMQEFIHHQEKLEEYALMKEESVLLNDVNDKTKPKSKHLNLETKNVVDSVSAEVQHEEMMGLKRELHDGYKRLELKSKKGNFTEVKADFLWQQALKGNFTEHELISLMDELKHFEQKVKKHEHYKREADRALKHYNKIVNGFGDIQKPNSEGRPPKHEHLKNKEKDLFYKVKKLYSDFAKKIGSRDQTHNEL